MLQSTKLTAAVTAILFLFFIDFIQGQNRSFLTLPLAKSDTLIKNSEGDLNHTKEYQRVLTIYNKLVNARGDFRVPVPSLFLKDEEGYVAYIDYNTTHITLEKKAFDVVSKHGDNAIAFLLAHELAHYYEKHAWRRTFVNDNNDLKIGQNLNSIQDGILLETEADYIGGFLAYTAGYGLFDDAGIIIKELYEAYGLQDNLPGYPSKNDRIELCNRSADKLSLLIDAFEFANMLFAAGKNREAYDYYKFILKHYQSRELYNNLGTIAVINAMELMDKKELKYKYVTELDLDFEGSKDVTIPVKKQIQINLNQAIAHFNSAINLDPNYAPAYLNKANAYALKKEYLKAEFYLNQEALPIAKKNSIKNEKTLIDIGILNGILLAIAGKKSEAEAKFMEGVNKNSKTARLNLSILKNEALLQNKATNLNPINDEFIDEISVKKYFNNPLIGNKMQLISSDYVFQQYNPKAEAYRVFLNMDEVTNFWTAFIFTTDQYKGTDSKGIKINDSNTKLIKTYGNPNAIFETTQGQIYSYPNSIFYLKNGEITRLISYGKKRGY